MTRRRLSSQPAPTPGPGRPVTGSLPADEGNGVWYAVLIGAVLLVATGIYAYLLRQEVEEWQRAADQLQIGQELLRADRDEILRKVREQDAAVATFDLAREQDRVRLDGLEVQRRRLRADVLRLTGALAQAQQQVSGTELDSRLSADIDRIKRDRDRLGRQLDERQSDIERLEIELADLKGTVDENKAEAEAWFLEKAALEKAGNALEIDRERARLLLATQLHNERIRQILRGHRASLGEVTPYIAEIGPGDWIVIESWLALQLQRPMAVPDLAAHDWSYEGARLIGASEGPPMVMLLYADADGRPVSLTIAPDRNGEQPLAIRQYGEFNVLEWREERHAFFLAGETEEDVLKIVGGNFLNQPPRLSEDAPVPVSRYIRPRFRPADQP